MRRGSSEAVAPRLVVSTRYYPSRREAFMTSYVTAVTRLGVDVSVVITGPLVEEDVEPVTRPGAIDTLRVPWEAPPWRKVMALPGILARAVAADPRVAGRLCRRVLRRNPTPGGAASRLFTTAPLLAGPARAVHFGWISDAIEATELLDIADVPTVVSCHGSDLRLSARSDPSFARAIREVFARIDIVHCVSHELAGHAVDLGADPAKVHVGAWGVDLTRFSPTTRPAPLEPVRIITVARYEGLKGHEYALEAIAAVVERGVDASYVIVGSGTPQERQRLIGLVRRFGLEDRVELTGWISPDDVAARMRQAHLFLLASTSEGLNNSTLEAMATGLPVVVTDVGGMPEAVTDGVEGFVVPAREPDALADAIARLVGDRSAASAMGDRGRARVLAHFDGTEQARRLLERMSS
ncbi:MAG: glycosyltransferase family 4 protein [Acidimicrobiales bacterium]